MFLNTNLTIDADDSFCSTHTKSTVLHNMYIKSCNYGTSFCRKILQAYTFLSSRF